MTEVMDPPAGHDTNPPAPVVDKPAARDATAEDLFGKKPKTATKTFTIDDVEVTIHFRAIGRKLYDTMLNKCPPSTKQRADGAVYDQEAFAPMLLEKVVTVPAMSEVQWRNLWNSDEWGRSELADLFFTGVEVCSQPLNLPPGETD